MRLVLSLVLLSVTAAAQPVETERGASHTVTVSPGDALLMRFENRSYGPASDAELILIVQPDGEVFERLEVEEASVRLLAEHTHVIPDAMPGTWTATFISEPSRYAGHLFVELIAAPVLPLSIHEAARYDDLAALQAAIEQADGRVDEWNGNYMTALMVAAANGSVEAVRRLLDAGADPNAMAGYDSGHYEMTMSLERPLHYAASAGEAEIVTLLLDAGADPNASDAQGMSAPPLVSAVYSADLNVVRRLVAGGADVDAHDQEGRTAAELATDLAEREWTDDADRPVLREIAVFLAGEQ